MRLTFARGEGKEIDVNAPFRILVPYLIVLCIGSQLSCDLSAPSETFYNNNARPPSLLALDVQNIRPGQYIAGRVSFVVTPTLPSQDIRSVVLVVDDAVASMLYAPPYAFDIDTKLWPDGPHQLSVGVVKVSSPELGLLNILGAPAIVYTVPVVFDQRPPTPVVLDSVVWDNASHSPRLFWRQSNDSNFYGYIISKEGNFGKTNPHIVGEGIDTVFDRAATSYLDTSAHQVIGIELVYSVNVTNRETIAAGSSDTIRFGQRLPVSQGWSGGYLVRPIRSSLRDELYVVESGLDGGITAISTLDNTVSRTIRMGNFPQNFALSRDETRLYVISSYAPKLTVLDAGNFNIVMTADLSFSATSLACGRPNRLYLTTSYPFSGPVKIVDATTGAEVGDVGVMAPNASLAISSDNNTLYVAETIVHKIDITTDTARVIAQRLLMPDQTRLIQLSPDDQRLYVVHNSNPIQPECYVDIWSTSNLASIHQLNTPDRIFDFIATSSAIFVSYGIPGGNYSQAGRIVEYTLPSLGAAAAWDFVRAPEANQISRDNHFLYSFNIDSWVVPLIP